MEPESFPTNVPNDIDGKNFPVYVMYMRLNNKEIIKRDWLTWSTSKQAIYCFPCRLFCKLPEYQRSLFSMENGWQPSSRKYAKLYTRIPEHENSRNHKLCYMDWRALKTNLSAHSTVNQLLERQLHDESEKLNKLLERLLDVILFISERGLAFRGDSQLIDHWS